MRLKIHLNIGQTAHAHGLWFVDLWKPKTYPETICVTFERQRKEFIKHQIRINVKSRTISSYWAILVNPYCYCQVLKNGIKHSDKFQPISSFAIIAFTWSHTSHELRVATTNIQTPDFYRRTSCSSPKLQREQHIPSSSTTFIRFSKERNFSDVRKKFAS